MRTRALACAATAAALAAVLAAPADAAFPGTNGRIAFSAFVSNTAINTVNPDGTGLANLTPSRDHGDVTPAWSADGAKIAYVSNGAIRSMTFEGRANIPVGPGQDPDWSPDGTKIAFEGCCATSVRTMNANGSGVQTLASGFDPAWSPDGTKIAFTRNVSGRIDIWTMTPSGGSLTNITADAPSGSQRPDWSPDGSKIVFMPSSTAGIWTMNADGSGKAMVRATGREPAWSPDGTRISFAQNDGLYAMDAAGTNEGLVIAGVSVADPDWQPCTGSCPSFTEVHDVTGAANRAYIAFVPNFRQTISSTQCQARGGTVSDHGPPFSFTSCAPVAYLPGTIAHQGPNGESGVIYRRGDGFGGSYFGYDSLVIEGGGTDIRNAAGNDYNPASGPDATLATFIRVTDTFNGPGLNDSATGQEYELLFPIACSPDPEPDFGSTCAGITSVDALLGSEALRADRHAVIQLFEVRMKDVGLNGVLADSDDRPFVIQGVWIP